MKYSFYDPNLLIQLASDILDKPLGQQYVFTEQSTRAEYSSNASGLRSFLAPETQRLLKFRTTTGQQEPPKDSQLDAKQPA